MELTVKAALEEAVDTERKTLEFLEGLRKVVKNLGTKTLIDDLSAKIGKLKVQLEEALANEDIEGLGLNAKCYFGDLGIGKYKMHEVVREEMSGQDVLTIAIQYEEKALKFYESLAEQFQGQPSERLFLKLAVEKACMRNDLQRMYDEIVMQEN